MRSLGSMLLGRPGVRQNIMADVEGEHLPREKGSREKSQGGKNPE